MVERGSESKGHHFVKTEAPKADPVETDGSRVPRDAAGSTLSYLAYAVIILAGLSAAQAVVVPVLLGTALTVATLPVSIWVRPRLGRVTATVFHLSAVLGSVALFSLLLAVAGTQFSLSVQSYRNEFRGLSDRLSEWLRTQGLESLIPRENPEDALQWVLDAFQGVASLASTSAFVLIVTLFSILELAVLDVKLERLFARRVLSRHDYLRGLRETQRYLLIKTLTCALTGLLAGIWVWTLGLTNPLLWGLLAFALNYIPVIGSLVAGIVPVVLALVELSFGGAALVAVGYLVINLSIGNILEPRIMGQSLGLSPVAILLSVALWGFVLGPVGALLAVPMTMVLKIHLEQNERFSFVADLMSGAQGPRPKAGGENKTRAPET